MAQDVMGAAVAVATLALALLVVVSTWKVFEKAGEPGWASLIPIYNVYVMLKIGNNPGWYLVLLLVPVVNLFVAGKLFVDLARSFGKGIGWGLGLWILPFVFFPMLGFGGANYRSPGGGGGQSTI